MGELTTMPKYEAYKDSGVEWLGIVPEHWDISPLCSKATLKSITNRNDEELLSVYLDKGVIRFQDVESKRTNVTSLDLSKYQLVEIGDFVLNNQQAWRGSVGVSDYQGIVSPAYLILKLTEEINPRFGNYFFRDRNMVSQYLICSKGVGTIQRNLYWPQLKRVPIALPSFSEQTAIANFLDKKTAQIDEAIAIKEKQIELLKERKQIIIQQAVTQGISYEGKPDAPMKDSGVDWIGEIPEHWDISKVRYLGTTQNGISAGAEYFGSGFPFVSYGDVYKNRELPSKVSGLAKSSTNDRKQYSILENDILFTRTSETAEEIGFASICMKTIKDSTFAGFLIRFRPTKRLFKGFSKYYFNAAMMREYFVKEMNLVIRASLSQELLKNLPVLLPSLDEQELIFNYLENETSKIEDAIDIQIQQIEKLKEYKTTLINSAVTGKIKVPEVDSVIN
ncbi:restriction endonuclease subunit S [Pseudoalteromonas luteoviolacea]|uniref:restriction endonuclease subunit S n=1 Tax=Pseudoalteromonas luteoviolacea TaxID=43657 RepID=UPI001EEEC3B8|nr:restriction endonuclease subunit S [Pseudoalteromonas luteoviolacea]MCF6441125.1 restriction endonuclease subunit S [Pseudoalteromonas luteoviolacea]